jgi:hypothetical protein
MSFKLNNPPPWRNRPGPKSPVFTITLRHSTRGRTILDEWSPLRRDLYLTTHRTYKTDIRAYGGIGTRNPSKSATADPRGHQTCWLVNTSLKSTVLPSVLTTYEFWLDFGQLSSGVPGGGGGYHTKFRSFDKAEPNSQFCGKYIRNNLIRILVSLICKLVGTPNQGATAPQIPVLSAPCPQLNLLEPPPPEKFLV